jgi:cob(I)alamin adenosyltransferase
METILKETGKTFTLKGEPVSKSSPLIDALGNIDELRAYLSKFNLLVKESKQKEKKEISEFLMFLLETLINCGTNICLSSNESSRDLNKQILTKLDERIEKFKSIVPPVKNCIITYNNILSCEADILRTIVRRFERTLVRVKESSKDFGCNNLLTFTNSLSTYFFLLSRYLELEN